MEIIESINKFLTISSSSFKLTDTTIKSYKEDLDVFIKTFSYLKDTDQLNYFYLDDFKYELSLKNLKPATIRRRLSTLQAYFSFLESSHIKEDLIIKSKLPHYEKILPNVLKQSEIAQFLNFLDSSKKNGIRNKAMFNLMYSAGLKVSELINLKINNINFYEKFISIKEGKSHRIVPIRDSALEDLKRYLEIRNKLSTYDKQTIFINKNGQKLTRQYIYNELKTAGVKAGLIINLHPYILRHSFATHLLENGASLKVVQQLLGHKNIETSKIYTQISQTKNQDTYDLYWNKK